MLTTFKQQKLKHPIKKRAEHTFRTFKNDDSDFDGESFNNWVNNTYGEGQGAYYTGEDAQNVLNDIMDGGVDNFFSNTNKYKEGGGCRKTAIDSNGYVLGSDTLGNRLRERQGIIDLTWNNEYYEEPPR